MVGMTRAHIADPNIVSKIQQGRSDDIRPCVGANVCISKLLEGLPIRCIHNPEAGRVGELKPLVSTHQPKKVTVIGGGPSGLEAARVTALKGHSVEIFERQSILGGQLRQWATSPAMDELMKIIEWQENQLKKLGVKVYTNSEMNPDKVVALEPNSVVIATGSYPISIYSRPWIPDLQGDASSNLRIVTPHEVLESKNDTVKNAIIWDHVGGESGSQMALSCAELIAKKGAKVQIVTPNFSVGEDIHPTMRTPMYERLFSYGMNFIPNNKVTKIHQDNVITQNVFSGKESVMSDVDMLVTCLGNEANDSIYHSLNSKLENVHIIGDSLAPRTVESAMADGAKIARKL
ncbi:FAD-dependent oxidoreductase [Salicibibacter cibarius]